MTDHIIVLPGGGYEGHAPHEAEPFVDWFAELGVAASVFRYPIRQRYPIGNDAILAEVRRVRAAGADRVGVIGFSAGGHAAGLAALTGTADSAIDLVILCYPVVSMQTETHRGSRENLIGADASTELRRVTSVDRLVTSDAPPFFIWHTAQDEAVPVHHAYLLADSLAEAGVPHELHVFERGAHGLGLAVVAPGASAWTGLAAAWLRGLGWVE